MTRIASTISYSGPFFEHDPAKTFLDNVELMMEGIAREGESDVRAQLRAGEGSRKPIKGLGRLSDNVHGRVRGNVPWHRWVAISPFDSAHTKDEAIALYAAAGGRHTPGASRGTTEGVENQTHAFRRTATRLRRAKLKQIEELLRGIA